MEYFMGDLKKAFLKGKDELTNSEIFRISHFRSNFRQTKFCLIRDDIDENVIEKGKIMLPEIDRKLSKAFHSFTD